jgi:heparin/heparan-sulfate lyase
MIARTGWDEESAIVEMKVNVYYFADHMHLDAGTFQIYHKGPLALDAGLYRSQSSEHDHNYYKRTIAHNGLLIYDPDEQFGEGKGRGYKRVNDGGQRMPNDFREPRNLDVLLDKKNGYKVGEIIGHWFGPDYTTPDYTYLKGDITEAYSQKVKEVKRSFVFLNTKKANVAGVLIVFDKIVSSNPQFKKFWLLHSMEEPSINGNESIITRTEYGERGKLITSTLLPKRENIEISSIGGPGKEFWVAGSNHPPEVLLRGNQTIADLEAGAWRIEVSPKTSASTDYFLNVMQIMDRENGKKQEVTFIEDKNIYGVKIVDRVVVFNNESAYMDRPFKFTVSGSGTYKFLITDLIDGTWQIWKDGSVFIPALVVSKDEGILYYEGSSGTYELRR